MQKKTPKLLRSLIARHRDCKHEMEFVFFALSLDRPIFMFPQMNFRYQFEPIKWQTSLAQMITTTKIARKK